MTWKKVQDRFSTLMVLFSEDSGMQTDLLNNHNQWIFSTKSKIVNSWCQLASKDKA